MSSYKAVPLRKVKGKNLWHRPYRECVAEDKLVYKARREEPPDEREQIRAALRELEGE